MYRKNREYDRMQHEKSARSKNHSVKKIHHEKSNKSKTWKKSA